VLRLRTRRITAFTPTFYFVAGWRFATLATYLPLLVEVGERTVTCAVAGRLPPPPTRNAQQKPTNFPGTSRNFLLPPPVAAAISRPTTHHTLTEGHGGLQRAASFDYRISAGIRVYPTTLFPTCAWRFATPTGTFRCRGPLQQADVLTFNGARYRDELLRAQNSFNSGSNCGVRTAFPNSFQLSRCALLVHG